MVQGFIKKHQVRTVVDLGCGDFRIGQKIISPALTYTGVDVVASLIERNEMLFANEKVHFHHLDIVEDELPDGDLCILRQVLQHLSNGQIEKILLKLTRYHYVIVAEHQPRPGRLSYQNLDKAAGQDTRLSFDSGVFLEEEPFSVSNLSTLARLPIPPII